MGTTQSLDDVLEHYGIKGMKWGVRRTDAQLARARGKKEAKKPSEDSKAVAETKAKVKKGGVQTLSNKELANLNKRLNLEKNYSDLTKPSKKKKEPLSKAEKDMIAWLLEKGGKLLVSQVAKQRSTQQVSNALNKADFIDLRK